MEEKPQEQKDVTFASMLACFAYCCKISRALNNRKWKTGRCESARVCFRFRQFFQRNKVPVVQRDASTAVMKLIFSLLVRLLKSQYIKIISLKTRFHSF